MLADPYSNPIHTDKNNYTEDELHEAIALLTDNNTDGNRKRKRKQTEYWSDSDNDDWPKEDYKNKYPYDPTAEIPAVKRNVINLQQTAKETTKQQSSLKRSKPSGNVPATSMERLDYAIASRKNKPRGWSLGGRKTKRRTKRKTKRRTKRRTKRTAKTRRYNKRGGVKENKNKSKGVTKTNNSMINKYKSPPVRISGNENDGNDLYVQPTPGEEYIVEVEDPNAPPGNNFAHMAKIVGRDENAITPVYQPKSGLFE